MHCKDVPILIELREIECCNALTILWFAQSWVQKAQFLTYIVDSLREFPRCFLYWNVIVCNAATRFVTLCEILEIWTGQYRSSIFDREKFLKTRKKHPQKLLIIGPIFFSVSPIGPKYFFHKNGSLGDFYIMTLYRSQGCISIWDSLDCTSSLRQKIETENERGLHDLLSLTNLVDTYF